MKHEATLSTTIQLDGEDYNVRYLLQGDVEYLPAIMGRAPEDCAPAELYSDVREIFLLSIQDANSGAVKSGYDLKRSLLAALRKLPLADYLLENWQQTCA